MYIQRKKGTTAEYLDHNKGYRVMHQYCFMTIHSISNFIRDLNTCMHTRAFPRLLFSLSFDVV